MNVPEVRPDLSRGERVGLDEAIFCSGKNARQIEAILAEARTRGAGLLLTRLAAEQLHDLSAGARAALDSDPLSRTAFFGTAHASAGARDTRVGILSAGTSDLPAAREAQRTLAWYGEPAAEFHDVGVAGLWRLTDRLEEIRRFPVLIVAAGMGAARAGVGGGPGGGRRGGRWSTSTTATAPPALRCACCAHLRRGPELSGTPKIVIPRAQPEESAVSRKKWKADSSRCSE